MTRKVSNKRWHARVGALLLALGAMMAVFTATFAGAQPSGNGQWTWIGGSDTRNEAPVYSGGTLDPGGRSDAAIWELDGTVYLFGGDYMGSVRNDMWEYNVSTGVWSYISSAGTQDTGQPAMYGGPNVHPGGTRGAITWVGADDKLYLFGGSGHNGSYNEGHLNDMWCFDPGTDTWAWLAGSQALDDLGSGSLPCNRAGAVAWTRSSDGRLYLFGGDVWYGYGDMSGVLQDMWCFDPVNNTWVCVSPSATLNHWTANGLRYWRDGYYHVYSTSYPCHRVAAAAWIDASGNFCMFGGDAWDDDGGDPGEGMLNDVWRYSPSANSWTRLDGPSGAFDEMDEQPRSTSNPGSRTSPTYWTDSNGNLYMFGGDACWYDANQRQNRVSNFDDLWRYGTSGWELLRDGSPGQILVHGTLGDPAPEGTPGARWSSHAFTVNDVLYLFGGFGGDVNGGGGELSDMWTYNGYSPSYNAYFSTSQSFAITSTGSFWVDAWDYGAEVSITSISGSGSGTLNVSSIPSGVYVGIHVYDYGVGDYVEMFYTLTE